MQPCHRLLAAREVPRNDVPPVVVLAVLAVASQVRAQAPTSPQLELTRQYLAAAKARDTAKVASFYAEDTVVMPPNASPIKGWRAIQQDHERLFKESPSFELTATPISSETSGDLGYIQGEFVVKRQGAAKSAGNTWRSGSESSGEWKTLYDINNANHPPPAPPTPLMPPTAPQE